MKSGAEPRTPLFVRGAGLFDRIDYRLIETPEEKELIYSMRYRGYLHGGLIGPSEIQRVADHFDDAPNAWTFGIFVDGELCSSLRLHVLTPELRMSYTTDAFGDVLHPRLDRGEIFIDPSRFVADPEKAKRFPELPYLTVRLGYVACAYFNADIGTATVRAEHRAFYRRLFLQKSLCEPRPYPTLTKPLCLMAADYLSIRDQVFERFPLMRSSAAERRMLFERGSEVLPVLDLPQFPYEPATIAPQS